MIEVNPGDLNLPTLAGNLADLVGGSDLPNLLYVFGTREGSKPYCLDPMIPDVERLADFLNMHGYKVHIEMPYNPAKRPAVGISREYRADDIDGATRLCLIILLHLNGRLEI